MHTAHWLLKRLAAQRKPADDVELFDRWAPDYDRWRSAQDFFSLVQGATVDAALRAKPRPARVLDVGCGTGFLFRRFGERFPGAELIGVDPAPGMVRQARQAAASTAGTAFFEGQAEALPFPDASFDLVLTTISFHHWTDQAAGLRQVRRVLRPGGVFALTDALKTAAWVRPLLAIMAGRFFTPGEMDALLRAAAFERLSQTPVPRLAGVVRVTVSHAA